MVELLGLHIWNMRFLSPMGTISKLDGCVKCCVCTYTFINNCIMQCLLAKFYVHGCQQRCLHNSFGSEYQLNPGPLGVV